MAEIVNGALSINQRLPKPIAFNCWKHHMGYIKDSLDSNESFSTSHLNIHEIIQFIGDTNVDFYYGDLDPISISNQIINHIEQEITISIDTYNEWICSEGNDYKTIYLSDGSNWTLRLGQIKERFIHIHPSRHSKKTVRVKSSTLKTVMAYFFTFGIYDVQISVEKINKVRSKIAKLPSLKPTAPLVAVFRIADRFFV